MTGEAIFLISGYPEPPLSLLDIFERLYSHPAIYGNGFTKPLRIKDWLFQHVCKSRNLDPHAINRQVNGVRGVLAIIKTLERLWFADHLPPINQHFPQFVFYQGLEYLLKSLFRARERKLAGIDRTKQLMFGIDLK